IAIVNDLDQAVIVVVTASASDGRLAIDGGPVTGHLAASSRGSVSFAATAVSHGRVAVTARLTSVDGAQSGEAAVARTNVQAGWETPVAAAGAGLLLVIVVIGIIRTVRRVRRTKTHEAETPND